LRHAAALGRVVTLRGISLTSKLFFRTLSCWNLRLPLQSSSRLSRGSRSLPPPSTACLNSNGLRLTQYLSRQLNTRHPKETHHPSCCCSLLWMSLNLFMRHFVRHPKETHPPFCHSSLLALSSNLFLSNLGVNDEKPRIQSSMAMNWSKKRVWISQ
jgi:hypothetical protein